MVQDNKGDDGGGGGGGGMIEKSAKFEESIKAKIIKIPRKAKNTSGPTEAPILRQFDPTSHY